MFSVLGMPPPSSYGEVAAGVEEQMDAPRAGETIARRFFSLCENDRTRNRVMRTLRSSADSAVGGRLLVAMLSRMVFRPSLRLRRVDGAAVKVELIAAQLGGIAVLRYVSKMEPIASMSVDELVAIVAPSIQATLDGP